MKILTPPLLSLVERIEQTPPSPQQDELIKELIVALDERCSGMEPLGNLPSTGKFGEKYPIDEEGFAQALDPLTDEDLYTEYFQKYGFLVGKHVISSTVATNTMARIREIGLQLSNHQFDITNAETIQATPKDQNDTPLFSRGFFEVYHDDSWAQIRQSLRLYLHHVLIWGTPYLWTTFDRFGVKPPDHPESKALPLHTDQSPAIHADFRTIQGILALSDCPKEIGTTVLVPASRTHFDEVLPFTKPNEQFVELSKADEPFIQTLQKYAQQIPLRSGNILTWDSRCVHANTANFTQDKTRYVALVAAGKAKEDNPELIAIRKKYFEFGIGKNERDAYLHASIRPRYEDAAALRTVRQPEQLTLLGKCLYGFHSYDFKP